jgi:L-alanine-DL-glutamate epimerase-like enolase superfamily enzyme
MNIASADVYQLRIPMAGTYEIAGSATSATTSILVVLSTADGTRGIGTADPVSGHPIPQSGDEIYESLTDGLLADVLEAGPATPNEMARFLERYPGQENARCALQLAYLDAYCREREQSLAEFFGGAVRDVEPLNAWVGVDAPGAMATAAETWADKGFESLKMKIVGDPATDLQRIQAVHEAVGDTMQIRVDANEGYRDVDTAISVAEELENLPLAHLEQPVPRDDLEGLARVTAATSLTIMADEPVLSPNDGYRILTEDVADRLKFKILKSGGVMPVWRGLGLAAAADSPCVVGHGFCTTPAASAELQLTASHESVYRPVETVGPLKMAEEPFTSAIEIEDGTATVPNGPGLGVEMDEDRVRELAVASARIT